MNRWHNSRVFIVLLAIVLMLTMISGTSPVSAKKSQHIPSIEVHSKKQLLKHLKTDVEEKIIFVTDNEVSFAIPSGLHSAKKRLVLRAANASIINKASFASITVEAVKNYTEKTSGNELTVLADNARISISTGKNVSKLTIDADKINIIVNKRASIANLIINHKEGSDIKLEVSNKSSVKVNLKKKTIIIIDGDKRAVVDIISSYRNNSVNTNIPVNIFVKKKMKLTINEGAEDTTIDKSKSSIKVSITNNSKKVPAITVNGEEENKSTQDPTPTSTPTSTPISTSIPVSTPIPIVTAIPQPTSIVTITPTYSESVSGSNDGSSGSTHIHEFGECKYTWSNDGKKCTASVNCITEGCTEIMTENVDCMGVEKIPSTCYSMGTTTYTAKFTNNLFKTQVKDVKDIPATSHTFGTPTYTWSDDGKKCTASVNCIAEGCTEMETETIGSIGVVKEPATCFSKGITTYTTTFTNQLFTTQTKDIEDIDVLELTSDCMEGFSKDFYYRQKDNNENGTPSFRALYRVTNLEATLGVDIWINNDSAYIFFPSCANLDDVTLCSDVSICNSGSYITDGENKWYFGSSINMNDIALASPKLVVVDGSGESEYILYIKKSSSLPSVYIYTQSGSTGFIHESKENEEKMAFLCVNPKGNCDSLGKGTIKCHGDSSFFHVDKKTYRIKFDKRTGILGMDSAKKWIIQANVFDESKIRNRICYYIAEYLELPFAVNTEYIDLYVDNNYYGNYLIMDSINIAKNRIDIPEEDSFLIVADTDTELENAFYDCFDKHYTIKSPENLNEVQINDIATRFNQVETKIFGLNKEETLDELEKIIDIDSFAIMYLVDFISDEPDSNNKSTYYYYNASDDKIYAGPAWDFDRSLEAQVNPYIEINSYYDGLPEKLYENQYFRNRVKEIWDAHSDLLQDTQVFLEKSVDLIGDSVKNDFSRWGGLENLSDKRLIDSGGFIENVDYAKTALYGRIQLLDELIHKPEAYCKVTVETNSEYKIFGITAYVSIGGMLSTECISSMCNRAKCDSLLLADDSEINDSYVFESDTILYPQIQG